MSWSSFWTPLSASPLLWLTVTLAAFVAAARLGRAFGGSPIANPVLLASALVIALLVLTGTPYTSYRPAGDMLQFLLGPATVALAVPLYRNRLTVRRAWLPISAALVAGSLTAIVSSVLIVIGFGAPSEVVATIAPKSTTAPIAAALAETLGGIPALAAVIVIVTGIFGAVVVTPLMNFFKIGNYAARGFAVGVAAHGIGTARAYQVSEIGGVFASIGMVLNGLLTSMLIAVWRLRYG